MSRRGPALPILGAVLLVVALGGGFWWWRRAAAAKANDPAAASAATSPASASPIAPVALELTLYFPGEPGSLYAERRSVSVSVDPQERIRSVVSELLAGPRTPGLQAPLPAGVALGSADLADRVVYLDLRSQGPPPSSGSLREMLTVYSLVDSVLLNVPEAQSVVLLWNGAQPQSFAGHLDTTHPLAADTALVARGGPA